MDASRGERTNIFRSNLMRPASILGKAILVRTASPASGQERLELRVIDPSGAQVPTATVSIGGQSQPTDDSGDANSCGLGDGPMAS